MTPDEMVITGDPINTREAIRQLKERSGLSQKEIARRMGRSVATVQQFGVRKPMITVKSLAQFIAVCGGRLVVKLPEEG